MTQAKVFTYRSNLARKMGAPGGKSIDEALNAAEGALENHRDAAMKSLGAILTGLDAICARRAQGEVYEHAAALLDLAGFFDTGPLHPTVFSLCEISDCMTEDAWDWASVEVHLRAIRMILASGCRDSEDARVMLEGLTAIRQRLGKTSFEH